ncbi:MAG: hypothetical protein KF745_07565 [Phycisphaeraceae bacterium]|nr:hypothetical protein [Phycisphaeraceae bacterium]
MKKVVAVVIVIVVVLAAAGAGLFFMNQRAADKAAKAHENAKALIKVADAYKKNGPKLDELLEKSHAAAVQSATSAILGFDEVAYNTALFSGICRDLSAEGNRELARSVQIFAIGKNFVNVKMD